MSSCQISHMNIIPDACTIRRGVIITKNMERRSTTVHTHKHSWDQVRFRDMPFTSFTLGSAPAALK